ncbi:MAG: nucleotidyltransferase domain-containing protein [Candidatus Hydrogenedentes bacterium]|nr:nucleotidyltransferase domain-containing protein [Candidatus Hydrogenedentota bacterium]
MDTLVERIVGDIVSAVHPKRIILFGSRARGNAAPESDVDLVVVYDGPRSKRDVQLEIRRLFAHPGFSMDLFVMTSEELEAARTTANTLAREVAEHGVAYYG